MGNALECCIAFGYSKSNMGILEDKNKNMKAMRMKDLFWLTV